MVAFGGTVATLTWLGQAGFLIEGAGERILIDPWFSPHELRTSDPIAIEALGEPVGWLLATHEHLDHLDLPSLPALARHSGGIRVVVPAPLEEPVREACSDVEVVPVAPGDEFTAGAVRVRVVPAWHGVAIQDGYTDGGWSETGVTRFVGYVLRFPGLTLYHAGDTVASDALIEAVRPLGVDVALVPVNGRDFFREADGILGNLDAREAVELAARIGARTLVPMHHDMVRGNTADAGALVDHAARAGGLHVLIPARGRGFRLA
jgi:L-ascorbate 6-phosphate lactonase